jgi:hypothetical protein
LEVRREHHLSPRSIILPDRATGESLGSAVSILLGITVPIVIVANAKSHST